MVNRISPKLSVSEGVSGVLPNSGTTYLIGGDDLPKPSAVSNTTLQKLNSSITNFKEDDKGKSAAELKVSSWGRDNLFPQHLMSLYQNNIFPGLMDFKVDMLYSLGYQLYQYVISGKEKVKVPVLDAQVEDWLLSWDAPDFIVDQFTDFVWTENIFSQLIVNKKKQDYPIRKLPLLLLMLAYRNLLNIR